MDDKSNTAFGEPKSEQPGTQLPEIPCCPIHERLLLAGKVEPLDNCFVCIRNQRDEQKQALKTIYDLCVCITQSDPMLTMVSRDLINRIGELSGEIYTENRSV